MDRMRLGKSKKQAHGDAELGRGSRRGPPKETKKAKKKPPPPPPPQGVRGVDPLKRVGGVPHHFCALQGRVLDASCWSIMPCCGKSKQEVSVFPQNGFEFNITFWETTVLTTPDCIPVLEEAGPRRQLSRRQIRAVRLRGSGAGLGRVGHAQGPANSIPHCAARDPYRYAAPSPRRCRGGSVCIGVSPLPHACNHLPCTPRCRPTPS